jgi:hypothetical protein
VKHQATHFVPVSTTAMSSALCCGVLKITQVNDNNNLLNQQLDIIHGQHYVIGSDVDSDFMLPLGYVGKTVRKASGVRD